MKNMFKRETYIVKNILNETTAHKECASCQSEAIHEFRKEKLKTFCRKISDGPFHGLFYTFMCSICLTLSSVLVKKLPYISPGELSLIRNICVWFFSLPIAVYSVQEVLGPKEHRILLLVRSLLGATALYLSLISFELLPVAEAATINSALPAVVALVARVYLNESCGISQSCAIVLSIIGVLVSIRIPELFSSRVNTEFTSSYAMGLAAAVGCVIILAVTFVSLKKMQDVHFAVTLLYLGFLGSAGNVAITSLFSSYAQAQCGRDTVLVVLVAVFGFLGHCGLTLAIQSEAVATVSVVKASLDIIVAIVLQATLFQDQPDIYSFGGAVLVILSMGIIGVKKWLLTQPEGSSARKTLKIFLL